MNVFFVFDDGSMVTPPLGGTILPGITRDTLITLAREKGSRCARSAMRSTSGAPTPRSGRLREAFACGTAAVVTPIGTVRSEDGEFTIGNGGPGPLTEELKRRWSASSAATPPTRTAGSTRCFNLAGPRPPGPLVSIMT